LLEKRKRAAKFEFLELSRMLLQKHLDAVPAEVLARNLNRKGINLLQKLNKVYDELLNTFSEV
jgi:NAD(P)H-nitrite reductase large subunit